MSVPFRRKKWTEADLRRAVKESRSIRQVLGKLGLVEAGGNYDQVKRWIDHFQIDSSHFTGRGWNISGLFLKRYPRIPTHQMLKKDTPVQSFKLKARLFAEGLKKAECELCGWKEVSSDGRVPVELDHINGDKRDNRITNLRILCPNCHSLQSTHRGKNKKRG